MSMCSDRDFKKLKHAIMIGKHTHRRNIINNLEEAKRFKGVEVIKSVLSEYYEFYVSIRQYSFGMTVLIERPDQKREYIIKIVNSSIYVFKQPFWHLNEEDPYNTEDISDLSEYLAIQEGDEVDDFCDWYESFTTKLFNAIKPGKKTKAARHDIEY